MPLREVGDPEGIFKRGLGWGMAMRLSSDALRTRILQGDEPEWLRRHPRRSYLVQFTLSTPPWVDRKALYRIRQFARRHGLVCDHIVPLTHPLVCGLTVPWNIRCISAEENAARSNRWWEFTEPLFGRIEQLRLL